MRKSERALLTELLQLYKENQLLWNPRDTHYTNQHERTKAYKVLLEHYKKIDEHSDLRDLKKKLENMRTSFRKEHKKVLESELRGDGEEDRYRPHLWYYKNMLFLNDVCQYNIENMEESQVEVTSDRSDNPRKRKRSNSYEIHSEIETEDPTKIEIEDPNSEDNSIYDEDQEVAIETHYLCDEPSTSKSKTKDSNTVKAFASVVGMQLKDVEPTQRVIAEKLISDVVFLARMNKLTMNSVVLANSE